jgi:hypothetical protein
MNYTEEIQEDKLENEEEIWVDQGDGWEILEVDNE